MSRKRKKYIRVRDFSNETLRNFSWNSSAPTVTPDFSFDAVLQLLDRDPVARGAVTHFVDKTMEGDYSIVRRDNFKYDKKEEQRLEEKYMFRTKILRKIFLLGKLFNNVFIEVVKTTDGKTKALNILDSTNIEPETDSNGDPISYKGKTPNPSSGEYPTWDKDEITWVKFGDRTAGYAPVEIKTLWENLLLKHYVTRYVSWLWQTGQYRVHYNFEKSSNADIQDFLAYARKNDRDFSVPFISKGLMKTGMLRNMEETQHIDTLLKYLDSQTLILLRVPPIDAGIPDASGRSNADQQANNIESTVRSAKKVCEDYVNFDLFPKINKSTILLKFGPQNRFAYKQAIGVASELKGMGISDKGVREFLEDSGIYFETKKLFEAPKTDVLTKTLNNGSTTEAKKDFGEGNKPREEVTTREDQLKKV